MRVGAWRIADLNIAGRTPGLQLVLCGTDCGRAFSMCLYS